MSQLKIAELIVKAGRAAAQTKYGKAAVQKVEKFYDDYVKKLTKDQESAAGLSQKQKSVRRTNLKKYGKGLAQGAVGVAVLNEVFGGRGGGEAEATQRKAYAKEQNEKKTKPKSPEGGQTIKENRRVVSETRLNKGGVIKANAGASVKPNRMARK
jgi:hypothetical protein